MPTHYQEALTTMIPTKQCYHTVLYSLNIVPYSEESTKIPGVGIDMLLKDGKLDHLKDGPVYWVDSADVHPCLGTASASMWTLKCRGRLFHSGLPHKVECVCAPRAHICHESL